MSSEDLNGIDEFSFIQGKTAFEDED